MGALLVLIAVAPVSAVVGDVSDAAPDDPCRGMLRLQTIRFDSSSDRIRVEDSAVLDEGARILRTCPAIDVRIEGRTDARGSDAFNLDLSRRRAKAVKRYLVRSGIEAERLHAVGLGRSEPLDPGDGEKARRANRRVTLEFEQRGT